jgi:hypothetical protein
MPSSGVENAKICAQRQRCLINEVKLNSNDLQSKLESKSM